MRGGDLVDRSLFLCFNACMGKHTDDPVIPQHQLDNRKAHGVLKVDFALNGSIKYAERVAPPTILKYLTELDILTQQHEHAGHTFEVWRASFIYPVGYHSNQIKEMMRDAAAQLQHDGLKPQQYRDLLRLMRENSLSYVQHAVYTPAVGKVAVMAYQRRHNYGSAFDELIEAIDLIRKINDTEKNGHPNCAPQQDTH